MVRTGRNVVGQIMVKFRNPGIKPRTVNPYPLRDVNSDESYTNLSVLFSAEQLMNSTLEDLIIRGDLELKSV